METQTFVDGALRVAYPGDVDAPRELSERTPGPRGADRGPLSADDPTALIVAALGEQQFDVVQTVELVPPPAARSKRMAEPLQSATWTVDLELEADENAVVLLDHDGVVSWQLPTERTERGATGRNRAVMSVATVTFRLTVDGDVLPGPRQRGARGLIPSIGRVRAYVLKFIAKAVAGQAMTFLERNVQRGLVLIASHNPKQWRLVTDLAGVKLPSDRPARILLLVHGTFSSTVGSFAGLAATAEGRDFLKGAIDAHDAVVGFDHPTLSRDPMENATDLLNRLMAVSVPVPPTIDIVCYSRGALVARSLVEALLPSSPWRDSSSRVVFVGGTNGGTSMAEPENWNKFIDLYTNLAMASTRAVGLILGSLPIAEIARGLIDGVGAFAKYLVAYSVDGGGVPGLAAMQPNGDFVRQINLTQPGQPGPGTPWFVVSSDFQPRLLGDGDVLQELPARLLQKLVDGLADQLFDAPNDLVVDTKSMSAVDLETGGFIADGLTFGANSRVYHLAYFIQPEVARRLSAWLVGPPSAVEVPQGSVVRGALPRSAATDIVVVSMTDPVSELRERLRNYPTWVVVRGTGRSRRGRGVVLDRRYGSPAIVSLDWLDDLYSLDTETITARIRGVPGTRAIADTLEPGDRQAATTVDIGDPMPEPAMVAPDDQPAVTVVIERGAPVAVVPPAAPPMSLDVIVDRRPRSPRRSRGVPIDDAGGPDRPRVDDAGGPDRPHGADGADEPDEVAKPKPTVTAHVTARMPDRVQHLKDVSVVCTLSRDGLVLVGGQQGFTDGVDPTRDVIVQLIPIRNAEVIGDDRISLPMPPPGKVETLVFSFVPSTVGACEVWVVARQDVRPLVTLSLTANCDAQVAGPSRQPPVEASVPLVSNQDRGPSLVLNIYEIVNAERVSYLYDMLCPELGIAASGSSADLGDRKDYVDSIYRDIENVRINDKDDADRFLQNLQDIGSGLFTKLFPVEVQKVLWQHRDKLDGLVVRSNEPFIPWELVHLKDPSVRRRPDEQLFLGQFGLVRWLNLPAAGLAPWPPTSLRRRSGKVRALCATYKDKHTPTLPEIKEERKFLAGKLKAKPVDATYDAVRDLLNEGDFDIFHFAGHGIARDGYTQAVIQIADEEPKPGDFTPIDFSAVSVEQNAELDKEGQGGPLVFLNACQGGRAGVQLGSLGGFAQAFLCGGAGAFVSTLWSVGDNIARTFGEEFYKRLIAGETVSTAVRRAREAGARTPDGQRPDVSWLAYVVYANPNATLEKP